MPSTPSSSTTSASPTATETITIEDNNLTSQHIKGLKLALLLSSLTLVTFLSFLDTSIIGTVSVTHL